MESTGKIYFSKLDHLRFLAALLVIFWHSVHEFGLPYSYVPSFWPLSIFNEGHTGVALFMTLSGFIFQALVGNQNINSAQFYLNRLLRIAPLFLVWTFILFWTQNIDSTKIFLSIFSLLNKPNVLGNGWAIVVEFQFYLIFPFLILFTRSRGIHFLFGIVFLALLLRTGIWVTKGTVQEIAYWSIFGRIDNFLLGMICCYLYRLNSKIIRNPLFLCMLVIVLICFYRWFNLMGGYNSDHGQSKSLIWVFMPTIEGALYGLIMASYLSISLCLPKLLDRLFAWLGCLSFSLYMNHAFVISIAQKVLIDNKIELTGYAGGCIFFIIVMIIVVPISALTYYLIEEPFLKMRKVYLM